MTMTIQELFSGIDFKTLADIDFKEDSVREVIVMPIIKKLGFNEENIVRSKTLQHPFLKIGSNKKISVKLVPDYVIRIGQFYPWVLDAKSPKQKITSDENVEQVYSYATHPEIRSNFFALCNGLEFSLYRTSNPSTPLLYFKMEDIEANWEQLERYLSINSSQITNEIKYENVAVKRKQDFDYKTRPLLKEIIVKKQAAKRHFGVHGYFTRQSWNVVQEYIKNYTQPGDIVLDPFGGSGITAIEALMIGRKTINIDLNPLAVFLVEALIAPVNRYELAEAFEKAKEEYLQNEPKTKDEIEKVLKKYKGCKVLPLPKGSDVPTTEKLFTRKQMAELSLLKSIIKKQKNKNIRDSLMLMFSGLVTRINLTFQGSKINPNGGNASAFQFYRYRIAPNPLMLDVMKFFELRYKRVSAAKADIEYFINENTIDNAQILKGTATDLNFVADESVDYIYTDPPYGKKIPYLDLSVMWNAWLDLDVSENDYKLEAIEGGEHNKTKQEYNDLIAKSIKEMYRVLKFDRWMSFVFAHKDPEFWHLIIETAENCGFEYIGSVPQKNGQTSFKKRQNPFTVLSGQLIINFRKTRDPKLIMKANLGMDISNIVMQTIEGIIAKHNGATIEQINDELIIKGLELGFLDLLKKEYSDLTPLLMNNFDYNSDAELYTMRKDSKFTTQIDIHLRIRYYLISYLRRMTREKYIPTFDEIVMNIMPLLKNGLTPDKQTILTVLEGTAVRVGKDGWKLDNGQLF